MLKFGSDMVANLSASRWGQRKIREVRIVTDRQLIEVDLLHVNVSVYRNISQSLVEGGGPYRAETVMDVPYVRHHGANPLRCSSPRLSTLFEAKTPREDRC